MALGKWQIVCHFRKDNVVLSIESIGLELDLLSGSSGNI